MRWGGRESDNVEYSSGGGRRMLMGGGIGTLLIAVVVYLLGGNPSGVLRGGSGSSSSQSATNEPTEGRDSLDHFVRMVLAQTEDVWTDEFRKMGAQYQVPTLHMFHDNVESACGGASSATGPFYCPADRRVYLDKTFFAELSQRFRAPGDFANAYVIAHEVGHHVQNLLGTSEKVQRMRQQSSERESNRLSVMLELQADFYAGIWAHHMQQRGNVVEQGDIENALNAASAVGDDRIQQQTRGHVVPDAFTHGSSQQRMYWFKRGFETGDVQQGNTFREVTAATFHVDLQKRLVMLGVLY